MQGKGVRVVAGTDVGARLSRALGRKLIDLEFVGNIAMRRLLTSSCTAHGSWRRCAAVLVSSCWLLVAPGGARRGDYWRRVPPD